MVTLQNTHIFLQQTGPSFRSGLSSLIHLGYAASVWIYGHLVLFLLLLEEETWDITKLHRGFTGYITVEARLLHKDVHANQWKVSKTSHHMPLEWSLSQSHAKLIHMLQIGMCV